MYLTSDLSLIQIDSFIGIILKPSAARHPVVGTVLFSVTDILVVDRVFALFVIIIVYL